MIYAFERVCYLAPRDKWCSNIFCGTCGHTLFRYAFLEISNGIHPDSKDWIVSHDNLKEVSRKLGKLPNCGGWPLEQQKKLSDIFVESSIKNIMSNSRSGGGCEWLMYIGLALLYTSGIELENRAITKSWVPQILELNVSDDTREYLTYILEKGVDTLKIINLDLIEQDSFSRPLIPELVIKSSKKFDTLTPYTKGEGRDEGVSGIAELLERAISLSGN